VAFKLAQALLEKSGRQRLLPSSSKWRIGTIADIVPLAGENRIFAKLGYGGLRQPVNPGLKALFDVAKLTASASLRRRYGFRIGHELTRLAAWMSRAASSNSCHQGSAQARDIAGHLDQLNADARTPTQVLAAIINGSTMIRLSALRIAP